MHSVGMGWGCIMVSASYIMVWGPPLPLPLVHLLSMLYVPTVPCLTSCLTSSHPYFLPYPSNVCGVLPHIIFTHDALVHPRSLHLLYFHPHHAIDPCRLVSDDECMSMMNACVVSVYCLRIRAIRQMQA